MRHDALKVSDSEASALLNIWESRASEWGCVDGSEICSENKQTLRRLEVISGCNKGTLKQCPFKATNSPDVVRALRLYRAQQSGGVSYDDDPPYSVFVGFEAISDSDAKRLKAEQESKAK